MPIRSSARPAEGPRAGRPGHGGSARLAVLALLLAGLGHATLAHESTEDAAPPASGWQLGAGLVLQATDANRRWPREARPGVLLQGSAPPRHDGRLMLAEGGATLGARLGERSAALAVGVHDDGEAHLEAAWLRQEGTALGGRWQATAGRQTLGFGATIDQAWRVDAFAQRPLALQAATDGPWIEDGLHLGWQPAPPLNDTAGDAAGDAAGEAAGEAAAAGPALRELAAGVWRARRFPAGPAGPAAPSVHLHLGWGHADLHLGAATMRPEARGAAVARAGQEGHLHGPPDCREGLAQKVCFDGRVTLWLASLAWQPEAGPLEHTRWALGAVRRQEEGLLYATGGEASLRSRLDGLWLDATWQPAQAWALALRVERLRSRHHLAGSGTALLAREAGLEGAAPTERATVALRRELGPNWQLGLEAGLERQAATQARHVALRLAWRQARLLGGLW